MFERSFEIGKFQFSATQLSPAIDNTQRISIENCFGDGMTASYAEEQFILSFGSSIVSLSWNDVENVDFDPMEVSHHLNRCTANTSIIEEKELFLHFALAFCPSNAIVARNLGFILECGGHTSVAHSLYVDCALISGDSGCRLHAAMVAPTILWDVRQSRIQFVRVLSALFDILRRPDKRQQQSGVYAELGRAPLISLRELPTNIQYLGLGGNVMTTLLSEALIRSYPELSANLVNDKPNKGETALAEDGHVITLGVISG
jgi:hypothetical protein